MEQPDTYTALLATLLTVAGLVVTASFVRNVTTTLVLPQTLDGQHLEECGVGLECRYETTVTRFSRSVSTELGLAAAASLLLVRHRSAD